jgi:hypothetical protein
MNEPEFIDYFVVTDENLKKRARLLTLMVTFRKEFKTSYEARKYMIESIMESPDIEQNFSLTIVRRPNPKYKLAERIEELEKELKEKKELLAQHD